MLLRTASKALIFAFLLYMYGTYTLWVWFVLSIFGSLYLYFKEQVHSKLFLPSFLVLIGASFLSISRMSPESTAFLATLSLYFGILFFILLGVKNLIFIHRILPYYFLNTFLFAVIFMLFFASDTGGFFIHTYLLLCAAVFSLVREFLGFNFAPTLGLLQTPVAIRRNIIALIFTFLLMEFVWVVALLPLGFLNAASFMVLVILLLEDLLLHTLSGTLTRPIILRNATFFLSISFLIFWFSKWIP